MGSSEAEAIAMLARDFRGCKTGEVVYVVTGEGTIWSAEPVRKAIRGALNRGAQIKCIVGPVIKTENGTNFLLELAKESSITMYVALRREWSHYRIFGKRRVWIEKYHEPLALSKERKGRYIFDKDTYSLFLIESYIHDFETTISAYQLKTLDQEKDLLLLERGQIEQLKIRARSKGGFFDDYDKEQLQSLLVS